MNQTINRTQVGHFASTGKLAPLNGKPAKVTLQGSTFPATLRATNDGTTTAVFDTPGIYFGLHEFEIAGPAYNNFTAHTLDSLTITV